MNYKIEIPPLRERKEDIIPIFNYYIEHKHHFNPQWDVVPEIFDKMLRYHWPGNIRQLTNLIDSMVLERSMFKKGIIDMDCFEAAFENVTPRYSSMQIPAMEIDGIDVIGNGTILDRDLTRAQEDMRKIEVHAKNPNYKKSAIADMAGYKGLDHMRSRIRICYKNYPEIFEQFPNIKKLFL